MAVGKRLPDEASGSGSSRYAWCDVGDEMVSGSLLNRSYRSMGRVLCTPQVLPLLLAVPFTKSAWHVISGCTTHGNSARSWISELTSPGLRHYTKAISPHLCG
jgi:hypothetical protein